MIVDLGAIFREAWIRAAEDQWQKGLQLPGSTAERQIGEFFREIGWQWALDKFGLDDGLYSEEARKKSPAGLNWCGIFIAAMGTRINEYMVNLIDINAILDVQVASKCLPSTFRMQDKATWKKTKLEPFRALSVDQVQRGDIITLKTLQNPKPYGDHIAIVQDVDRFKSTIRTIEGNATGYFPGGNFGRGVVQRDRAMSAVARVYRADKEHFFYGPSRSEKP